MKIHLRIRKKQSKSRYTTPQRLMFATTGLLSMVSLFAATLFLPLNTQVQAASPAPSTSPQPSASPTDEQTTENLKDRIDRVLEQRQEKLQELEDSGVRRRIFVGDVQRIIEQTVTLRTRRGNQSFAITPDLGLVRDGKAATLDDIAVGDWIAVIGYLDKETLQPQRVLGYSETLQPTEYETVVGAITDITRTQVTITDSSEAAHKYTLVRTTSYESNDGESIKQADFKKEDAVIILSKPATNQATAILVRSLGGQ